MNRKNITIALVGHVDHGKSTVLGRLLADTGGLPEGKLEQVRASCERNSKPFEYAFLIDALKDEQSQGITIDAARVFYRGKKGNFIFIDAPGHIEFLRNMVTGASRAEASLLTIDAAEGVRENSKRHGFLLSMLGVKQVVVVVNKMDLEEYSEKKFKEIVEEFTHFLKKINVAPMAFIPVSGLNGDNIARRSKAMEWYKGKTVLQSIDMFKSAAAPLDKPFRMPVQGVYKFTNFGDKRRIIAGTVQAGRIRPGQEVVFYPSGKKSVVKSIEVFNRGEVKEAVAGEATGFTLAEQVYVTRGELAITFSDPLPKVAERMRVSIFWLSKISMVKGKDYLIKIGSDKVGFRLEKIEKMFDLADLDSEIKASSVKKNCLAECIIRLDRPAAFDLVSDFKSTGRFVIVDEYNISGGGIVLGPIDDDRSTVRKKVLIRNYKWIKSAIPRQERIDKYSQQAAVIFITGGKRSPRKQIARSLEKELFKKNKLVYYLGLGNVLYGVDADIKGSKNNREEHLRRLAEVAHIMLDAGTLLLVTAIDLTAEDIELMRIAIGQDRIGTVWVGNKITTDIRPDLKIAPEVETAKTVRAVISWLKEKNIIFKRTASPAKK